MNTTPTPDTTSGSSYPQAGDTIQSRDRDRWFEVTAVSPGRYHVSGYAGFDHQRFGYMSGVRLPDVIAWVTHEAEYIPQLEPTLAPLRELRASVPSGRFVLVDRATGEKVAP